jgi:hypothetical protein
MSEAEDKIRGIVEVLIKKARSVVNDIAELAKMSWRTEEQVEEYIWETSSSVNNMIDELGIAFPDDESESRFRKLHDKITDLVQLLEASSEKLEQYTDGRGWEIVEFFRTIRPEEDSREFFRRFDIEI